ncbi:WbqC family protein [Aquimarina sp. MMG016]|uniref:WbqC family protein n=1 Tax=Aquimarina sp. MMG016 TaxID=2822690 RepID=UPI001B3A2AE5|nr:WbqC family protein [Aquimarina sp. MMG016]MBQ4822696.1 WbqC family protein [Aquimarina sp. MMG016]
MNPTLLHPMYFGSIAQYIAIAQSDSIVFENTDNYQKQTYRNRTYIYGANGKLLLTIPIKHTGNGDRQLYKDVRVENDFQWQILHWRSLETAYRTSPFFEYYEDEFAHLFEKPKEFLLDFNYECMEAVFDCLQLDSNYTKTEVFQKNPEEINDLRNLVNAKKEKTYDMKSYIQVFSEKYGFLSNLSILDLLFNEGTNALTYLESQSIFS